VNSGGYSPPDHFDNDDYLNSPCVPYGTNYDDGDDDPDDFSTDAAWASWTFTASNSVYLFSEGDFEYLDYYYGYEYFDQAYFTAYNGWNTGSPPDTCNNVINGTYPYDDFYSFPLQTVVGNNYTLVFSSDDGEPLDYDDEDVVGTYIYLTVLSGPNITWISPVFTTGASSSTTGSAATNSATNAATTGAATTKAAAATTGAATTGTATTGTATTNKGTTGATATTATPSPTPTATTSPATTKGTTGGAATTNSPNAATSTTSSASTVVLSTIVVVISGLLMLVVV
jgi:hypothetical protein